MKFGKKEGGGPLGALQNLLSRPQIANEAKKPSNHDLFLNCVYASLKLAMTVSWSVCLLVHPSVMISFFGVCGFWAAAPKGSMTYAFTHMGNFLLLPLLQRTPPQIPALRPKFQPRGRNPSLEAQILTLRT